MRITAHSLNPQLAIATADVNKKTIGRIHRSCSGIPFKGTRNRQRLMYASCGARVPYAFSVADFHHRMTPDSDMCLNCWPRWESLSRAERSRIDDLFLKDPRFPEARERYGRMMVGQRDVQLTNEERDRRLSKIQSIEPDWKLVGGVMVAGQEHRPVEDLHDRIANIAYNSMPWEGGSYQAVAEKIATNICADLGLTP